MSPGDLVFVVTRGGTLADPSTLDYVVSSATVARVEKNGLMVKSMYGFESFVPDDRLFFSSEQAKGAATQLMLADHTQLRAQSFAVDRKLFEIEGQLTEMMPLLDLNEKTYINARLANVDQIAYATGDFRRDPMVLLGGLPGRAEDALEDVRLARPGEKLERGDVTPVIVGMRDGSFLVGSMTCVESGAPNPVTVSFADRFDDIEAAREAAQHFVEIEMEQNARNFTSVVAELTGSDDIPMDVAVRAQLEKAGREIVRVGAFDLSVGQTKRFTGRVHAITDTTVYQEVRDGALHAMPIEDIRTPLGTHLGVGQTITAVHSYHDKDVNVTVHEQEQAVEISR